MRRGVTAQILKGYSGLASKAEYAVPLGGGAGERERSRTGPFSQLSDLSGILIPVAPPMVFSTVLKISIAQIGTFKQVVNRARALRRLRPHHVVSQRNIWIGWSETSERTTFSLAAMNVSPNFHWRCRELIGALHWTNGNFPPPLPPPFPDTRRVWFYSYLNLSVPCHPLGESL